MVTVEEDVTVIRVGNSLRIAIPSTIAKPLGIQEGDTVHLTTTDGEFVVRPLQPRVHAKKK